MQISFCDRCGNKTLVGGRMVKLPNPRSRIGEPGFKILFLCVDCQVALLNFAENRIQETKKGEPLND